MLIVRERCASASVLVPQSTALSVSGALDNLQAVLAAADMTLANIVRLNVYTTDFDELVQHWARLTGRFANSGDSFVTSLLGVTRLFTRKYTGGPYPGFAGPNPQWVPVRITAEKVTTA